MTFLLADDPHRQTGLEKAIRDLRREETQRLELWMVSGDFSRNSIIAERNEFRMTKVVIERPLKEFDSLRLAAALASGISSYRRQSVLRPICPFPIREDS